MNHAKTPLEKVEDLYKELVNWYGEGDDREIRAASKLLMVALVEFEKHGGPGWRGLVENYIWKLTNDPEKFARLLESNRGETKRIQV